MVYYFPECLFLLKISVDERKELRIVFMGTPGFAVASLKTLVENGYNVVGVITTPDKPAGRGKKLTESEVKKYAVEKGLKILQPEKLKNPEFLEELKSLQAELQVVVAFRMLPEVVWNMPRLGTFNLHASLLPQYRGQHRSTGPSLTVKPKQVLPPFCLTIKLIPVKFFFVEKFKSKITIQ
jgi:hypothetical protein